jgi:endonuclease/exonuclease/phosphatase (EEP) superfamily protein YafD
MNSLSARRLRGRLQQTALAGLLLFALALSAASSHAASEEASACAAELAQAVPTETPTQIPDTLSVLVWNLQKSSQNGWDADFIRLSADRDLLLLQEATLAAGLERRWSSADRHFAPGFQFGKTQTGVMTLSRIPASIRCQLRAIEPLLRTPKAVAVTRYRWASGEPLLVVNLHAVNFSLGMASFELQMNDISAVLAAHTGPLLVGGDFNTWREKRLSALTTLAQRHALESVIFSPDLRSQVFGRPLDHVLVRGLDVVEAKTERVVSSDHNPLLLTVRPAATGSVRH